MTAPGGDRLKTAVPVLAEIAEHLDGIVVLSAGMPADYYGFAAEVHAYTVRGAWLLLSRLDGVFTHTLTEHDTHHWSTGEQIRSISHFWEGTVLGKPVQIQAVYNAADGLGAVPEVA